jgi:competence CoiA-like predicted nuclease
MKETLYEGKYFDLKIHLESVSNSKEEIDRLKKRADKGAFLCLYCSEKLILRSGEIREEHFSHRHSKSCEVSVASDVYHKQTKRESKNHSIMKEIIYDELKTQEKIKPELQVEYGYITKAKEKWTYYPDIIIKNSGTELAISILTNINSNKDENLVKQIKKRNQYFKANTIGRKCRSQRSKTNKYIQNTKEYINQPDIHRKHII